MNLRNCRRCGKVYAYDGFDLCHDCRMIDEKDFEKVRAYLDENPSADINEISEKTEISTKKIIKFLREGRLELKDESNSLLLCERCGKPIRKGRFCEKCTAQLERELKRAIGQERSLEDLPKDSARERMRVTERKGKKDLK